MMKNSNMSSTCSPSKGKIVKRNDKNLSNFARWQKCRHHLQSIQSHLKISNESGHRLAGIRSACVKFYASDLGEWGCYCG
jgi:hypothetical protein